jgi:hypothetical protein
VVRGLGYRYLNFGTEFLAGSWFAGRIGAYRNLGADRTRTVFTGGLGFLFKRFSLPKGFAASLQFNWRPKQS